MSRSPLVRAVLSARTTVVILGFLALLLLARVVLPQAATVGSAGLEAIAAASPLYRFILLTLGLGDVPTSPVFTAGLALFFLDLAVVLADRTRATWRRTRLSPPTPGALLELGRKPGATSMARPQGFSAASAEKVLEALGYRVCAVGASGLWGIKHRRAALGFLVFHSSFFMLCAGGASLYCTRFVATLLLAEGQSFEGRWTAVIREPLLASATRPRVRLERVDPEVAGGKPLQLAATLRFEESGEARTARVNEPIEWEDNTLLVERVGLAPVLWLTDGRGYTLDRVVAPATPAEGGPPVVTLAGGEIAVELEPVSLGALPSRDELRHASVRLRVVRRGALLFDGALAPGEGVAAGEAYLRLEELRYWVLLRLVRERGGWWLVAGFLTAVLGLVWRMLWYRREVTLTWTDDTVVLYGRAEYYPDAFRQELAAIAELLCAGAPQGTPPPMSTSPA